jgi:hypothetical protein
MELEIGSVQFLVPGSDFLFCEPWSRISRGDRGYDG